MPGTDGGSVGISKTGAPASAPNSRTTLPRRTRPEHCRETDPRCIAARHAQLPPDVGAKGRVLEEFRENRGREFEAASGRREIEPDRARIVPRRAQICSREGREEVAQLPEPGDQQRPRILTGTSAPAAIVAG